MYMMGGGMERILIVGARASQSKHGEHLTDPEVAGGREHIPSITFYDINPNVPFRTDLPNLSSALHQGKVELVNTMPEGRFDAVAIATGSGQHASATYDILNAYTQQGMDLPVLSLEKPLAATPEEFAWFKSHEYYLPSNSFMNEPYLISKSFEHFLTHIHEQAHDNNPLMELFAWTSKLRKLRNPHGVLDIFGIELPHTHGVSSVIMGEVLGSDSQKIEENVHYADVDSIPGNDGNYMRFRLGEVVVHIAQGLGKFTMDQYGRMMRHDNPPQTRRLAARFLNGAYTELDINSTFKAEQRYGTLRVLL